MVVNSYTYEFLKNTSYKKWSYNNLKNESDSESI